MQRRFTTTGPATLEIRLPAADITLVEGDPGAVDVVLEPDDVAQRLGGDLIVEQVSHGGDDLIRIELPNRRRRLHHRSLHVRIACPAGTRLLAHTAAGDVTARVRLGEVSVETASGDVLLADVDGDVAVKTTSGDLAAGHISGIASAHAVSGDVAVKSADRGAHLTTVSGDIGVTEVREGDVSIRSVSGDVRVGIRRGSRFHLDAKTTSGDARSDLELDSELTADQPAGDGAFVDVRINTLSGDIRVERAATTN